MMGPKEKKERALGERLHLKGSRCDSPKCAAVRKPYRPGMHGKKRSKMPSDFGRQIMEKQKFKLTYGLDERNLRRLFEEAKTSASGTAMKLLELMERRLDNVVFRLGLASSRLESRKMVIHGHIDVNGKRVKSPGFQVSLGDVVSVRENSRQSGAFKNLDMGQYEPPSWLEFDKSAMKGKITRLPESEESPYEINLLVESFSK